ncbi:hypothetical protein ON010_g3118 [Phytophthora cinnamomi]|nr:hypothetical protein ON010_g3118 [Phytophthora cinnamomi]
MGLADGGRPERLGVDGPEHLAQGLAVALLDDGADLLHGLGRRVVLQLGGPVQVLLGQHVGPRGARLGQLHVEALELQHDVEDLGRVLVVQPLVLGALLLVVATETRSREALDQALSKFQRAVHVDGGSTFETRFQLAKALKEAGDLLAFLEEEEQAKQQYYDRALQVCHTLEEIYRAESEKQPQEADQVEERETTGTGDGEEEEDEDEEEDDDKVTAEDFAEAKLLEAVLQGLLEDAASGEDFHRTVTLYKEAIELNSDSAEALMEMTNYLAARCLARDSLGAKPTAEEWTKLFDDMEGQYKRLLTEAGFDLKECHEICHRKDTHDQEEPEEEEIDERVPHLLNALGKGLAAFVRSFPRLGEEEGATSKKHKQKRKKATGSARFRHAVEVLRSAHHFHDKLGGYHLACLYASPPFEDEEQCRTWLETADSYGSLEDEFDIQEFTTMHDKAWFKRLAQPPEQIDEVNGEDHANDEEDDD